MVFFRPCTALLVGMIFSQSQGAQRDERNFIGDTLGAISDATGLNGAVTGVVHALGAAENAVSPSGMYTFCHTNGYTQWRGKGPEPEAPSGAVGSGWSVFGAVTGAMVGSWAPDIVFQGKCHPLGWYNPSEPLEPGQTTTTVSVTNPGYQTTQYVTGTSPQYQVIPGKPGYTTSYTTGGNPQVQVIPGPPPTVTTQYITGTSPQYQVIPGKPGFTTSYTTGPGPQYIPGPQPPPDIFVGPPSPPTVQYVTGPPSVTQITTRGPGPNQCSCPCNG